MFQESVEKMLKVFQGSVEKMLNVFQGQESVEKMLKVFQRSIMLHGTHRSYLSRRRPNKKGTKNISEKFGQKLTKNFREVV